MSKFTVGNAVKILAGAKFASGLEVHDSLINTTVYVIEVKENGYYKLSQNKTSRKAIGTVHEEYLVDAEIPVETFEPYIILTTMETNTYTVPSYAAEVKQTLPKGRLFTVIFEENGYGRLKNNRGWIDLDLVTKIE